MTWFERLTGFVESSPQQVRDKLVVDGEKLISRDNGSSFTHGRLETPSLAELRERVARLAPRDETMRVREVVANVQALHADPANAGALFQVASQFNLLEMISPERTPEHGVGIYEQDHTQGPACAVAAGAGTIYRNYFADVDGQTGQSARRQIDCLADIGQALGNDGERLWEMRNGYALASHRGLEEITARLASSNEAELDLLRQRLRIGLQWNTEVTLPGCGHLVTQAYCSALPVAYSSISAKSWAAFARLVLEASYEATLCAARLNAAATGNNTVFLTFVGGGAYGNEDAWIVDALRRALALHRHSGLDVVLVSYLQPRDSIRELLDE